MNHSLVNPGHPQFLNYCRDLVVWNGPRIEKVLDGEPLNDLELVAILAYLYGSLINVYKPEDRSEVALLFAVLAETFGALSASIRKRIAEDEGMPVEAVSTVIVPVRPEEMTSRPAPEMYFVETPKTVQ